MTATLTILDHGYLESDHRSVYPRHNPATRQNPNPRVKWHRIPTFSLLLEYDSRLVAIDTGSHPDGMDDHWPAGIQDTVPWFADPEDHFRNRLDQVGYAPSDMDAVICTHLHNDHAGNVGLFADLNVPVYTHRDELEHAFFVANVMETGEREAYVPADYCHEGVDWQDLQGESGKLFDGLEWVHLPGHSPGTIGLLVTALPEPVFVVGDAAFRRGNLLPEVIQPGVNWDHAAWQTVAVPRMLSMIDDQDPNCIFGHDPETYNDYGDYSGVSIVGETEFNP
jgi:glyoxylase-like metal-dependent hydrolase (beta-lactamase superfamily II)